MSGRDSGHDVDNVSGRIFADYGNEMHIFRTTNIFIKRHTQYIFFGTVYINQYCLIFTGVGKQRQYSDIHVFLFVSFVCLQYFHILLYRRAAHGAGTYI